MILDRLENHPQYLSANPTLGKAFLRLEQLVSNPGSAGRYDDGEVGYYYMVQQYETRPAEACKWESHREYIDIQFIVSGHERMVFANKHTLAIAEYLPEKDFQSYDATQSVMYNVLDVLPGQFVVFFPEDAHMPCMCGEDGPVAVTKIVFKVKVSND